MKAFMVRVKADDGKWYETQFDKLSDADNYRMDAECGLGWYAEVWELKNGKYEFIYC